MKYHGALHFEIFALDADFKHFWRDRKAIPQGQHGSEDVFGDIHYIIPAGCEFQENHPNKEQLTGRLSAHAPQGVAGKSEDALHVVVRLEKGKRIATTYRIKNGKRTQIGQLVVQDNYEYDLFFLAKALYPDRPSAGFEYLRFGRILNGESTNTHQNWQWVQYGDGPTRKGYIDLAANNVSVLSDADFPLDWECIEEGPGSQSTDGIANAEGLKRLFGGDDKKVVGEMLDVNGNNRIDGYDFQRHIASRAGLAEKLRYLICKSPTEWDERTLEARYQALTQPGQPLANPDDWQAFLQHAKTLTFWSAAGMTETSVWHFHPLQFIRHYQNCGWLSLNELKQTLPKYSEYFNDKPTNGGFLISKDRRHRVFSKNKCELNKTMLRYGMTSRERQAFFLGQVILETGQWQYMSEYGHGAGKSYGEFYGRGIMQLTWVDNYMRYGDYHDLPNISGTYDGGKINSTSTHIKSDGKTKVKWHPRYDPVIIEDESRYANDSGGFFWVSKSFTGVKNLNRLCDGGYSPETVSKISLLVNGGGNGAIARQAYTAYLMRLLTSDIETSQVKEIKFHNAAVGKVNGQTALVPSETLKRVIVNFEKPEP